MAGGARQRRSRRPVAVGVSAVLYVIGLVAANVAGAAMAVSWAPVATTAVAVWVIDSAWRAARVGTARAVRPPDDPTEE